MRPHQQVPIAAIVLIGLVVAACGSAVPSSAPASAGPATPIESPTASPFPTASASPSPAALTIADVLARMADPSLTYSADITGKVAVGTTSLPVTGKLEVASGNSLSRITIETPQGPQGSEQASFGGKSYTRSSSAAPWFESPPSAAGKDLARAIAGLGNVVDKGLTTRDGKSVHHFATVPGAVPASGLGFDKPGVSGFTGSFDLYTDDSGKLVGLGLAADWQQQGDAGAPLAASMVLDFVLSDVKPVITAPEPVWVEFKSTRWPYTIGYPAEARVIEGKKPTVADAFGSSDEFYGVIQERQPQGVKLADYVKAYIDATYKQQKVKPESQADLTIAGRPGKVLLYHLKIAGQDRYSIVLMTLDGRDGYTIFLVANPGQEANANAFADQLLTTFKIGK